MTEQELTSTEMAAFHEAAHAVAAYVLELGLSDVHILKDDEYLGQTHIELLEELFSALEEGDVSDSTRLQVERHIILSLAGTAAEDAIRRGLNLESPYPPSSGDWRTADQLATHVTRSELERQTFVIWLWVRTRELVASHVPAINAVASELLRIGWLSGQEVGKIASEATREAAKNPKDRYQLTIVRRKGS
ncbi:MAG: hypothetical protein L6435_01195 [Anaerolineae bacterium]|nr:hypothetical protein [Anaerolineae bacterium]